METNVNSENAKSRNEVSSAGKYEDKDKGR
jgi:hypothetical protein